jgi:hypothetical protein
MAQSNENINNSVSGEVKAKFSAFIEPFFFEHPKRSLLSRIDFSARKADNAANQRTSK